MISIMYKVITTNPSITISKYFDANLTQMKKIIICSFKVVNRDCIPFIKMIINYNTGIIFLNKDYTVGTKIETKIITNAKISVFIVVFKTMQLTFYLKTIN